MTPAVTAWTSWFGDRVVRPCANPVGRGRTFHHFMRLSATAGLLVIVLASMSATAEVRLPKDVEKVLRDNGLSPRSRPAWNEKYSILIHGTEQKPELLTGTCPSRPRGRQSIQGKRFTYEADNDLQNERPSDSGAGSGRRESGRQGVAPATKLR